MNPLYINIKQNTLDNRDYRRVLYTTDQNQVVLMSLDQNEDIPEEIHAETSQFIRIESGSGIAVIEGRSYELRDGISLDIPAGYRHYITNNSDEPLKLYTVYSPPEHDEGLVQPRQIDYTKPVPIDVLKIIYGYLDDDDLLKACRVNKRINNKICNNSLWITKLTDKYPLTLEEIDKYKGNNSYAGYYYNLKNIVDYTSYNRLVNYSAIHNRPDLTLIALRSDDNLIVGDALNDALYGGYTEIVELLLSPEYIDSEMFFQAVRNNHIEIVKLLIDMGGVPDASLLFYAIKNNNVDMVKLLIDYGVDIHFYGDLALITAEENNNREIIGLLQQY